VKAQASGAGSNPAARIILLYDRYEEMLGSWLWQMKLHLKCLTQKTISNE